MVRKGAIVLVAVGGLALAGCQNVDSGTAARTGVGAGVGAATGAVIGAFAGSPGAGAGIGAAIGGAGGFLYDQVKKDNE
ncbi:MAG: glycine zipper family protein [Pseudomonadota bacterium]